MRSLFKKLCAVFLSVCLILSVAPSVFSAGTTLTLQVPSALPKAGESFTVSVDVSGNPGFSVVQFIVRYDKERLTCTGISFGKLLSGALGDTNTNYKDGAAIAAASLDPITGNGQIAEFTFRAKSELTELDFSLMDVTFADKNGTALAFTMETVTADGTVLSPTASGNETKSPQTTAQQTQFTDIAGHWGADYIIKAAERGLFSGYPDGSFHPDEQVTRAQFVTVLWRLAGRPEAAEETPFTDINGQLEEFRKAISWAYHAGYINGISETEFDPNGKLTREAAMRILFAYNGGQSGMEQMFTATYDAAYKDSNSISTWAKAPIYWGIYQGYITGTGTDTLTPQGIATRAQLAKIMMSYLESLEI